MSRSGAKPPPRSKADFPIVGLGASAGGLQAFEEFFAELPADSGMAFVVVSHLSPDQPSLLHELLDLSSALSVQPAEHGTEIRPNCVYVGKPGTELTVSKRKLVVSKRDTRQALPIDLLFLSLADALGDRAIAIVLSGNGSDGSLGLQAVREASGTTIVQDPETAKFDGMPRNALDSNAIDHVLAPGGMPELLRKIVGGVTSSRDQGESHQAFPFDVQRGVFALLKGQTGHDFSDYKTSTLERRIARRMNVHKIETPARYLSYLYDNPQEVDLLHKEFLIGVTRFFRDKKAFETLGRNVLPELLKSKADETVRLWVPGCSTGEEAYSLAILVREVLAELHQHNDVQIFATDIDTRAILAARKGSFPKTIEDNVSPARLETSFVRDGERYRLRKEVRESVVFAEQDVIRDPPFTKIDLVSCRNVLIYLRPRLQARLLGLFHYALNPSGILMLGTSETVGTSSELFEPVDSTSKLFRPRGGAVSLLAPQHYDMSGPTPPTIVSKTVSKLPNIASLSSTLLSQKYAPPTAIVNEKGAILYLHGAAGRFLEPAPGTPNHNILAMARSGLRLELSAALQTATSRSVEVVRRDLRVKADGGLVTIDLKISPIEEPESIEGLFLVSFETKEEPAAESAAVELPTSETYDVRLEQELEVLRGNLQHTIEKLEGSNEELKSTNEELQSTNEELQSTNEELETSKEEMQSLNEELQTVNSELEDKIHALSQVNDDMSNLLNATEIATLFLDNDLLIKRFTPTAKGVIRLIEADIGRSIADIVSRLEDVSLADRARQVLDTLVPTEVEVLTKDGSAYQMNVLPYRTSDHMIDGVVISFVNIDRLKLAEAKLAKAAEIDADTVRLRHLMAVVEESAESVLVLDPAGNLVTWNRVATSRFQLRKDSAKSLNVVDLVPAPLRSKAVTAIQAATAGETAEPLVFVNELGDKTTATVELRLSVFKDEDGFVTGMVARERLFGAEDQAE